MPLIFTEQYSSLSRFIGVDPITEALLPEQIWADKAWATGFADALSLVGLQLSWTACTVYLHGQSYTIPAGEYMLTADPTYATAIVIWLDSISSDNLTVDEIVLDGLHQAPAAPIVNDDCLRLAWGMLGASATELTLHVLRHVEV
jgi:hypothetical protein